MGLALLDTSIVVGALNRDETLHEAASRAVRAERDRHGLAVSTLTYAEALVPLGVPVSRDGGGAGGRRS
jgi:predicted nucleic acid-binding protein